VLLTGLLAGTLDILSAFAHAYLARGTTPDIILKFISSALMGSTAFTGGAGVAIMGLLIHYVIALSWTLVFFLIYPKFPFLWKSVVLTSILYGVFVWTMMTRIILPLSAIPKSPFNLTSAFIGAAIIVLMIGMPNAFGAKAFYRTPQ